MQLEGSGLSYRYGRGDWLFRDISLAVYPGEVLGLYGPSGSGKTTLARVMAGYELPSEGAVTLGGRPLSLTGACPVQLVFQHPERAVNPRWRLGRTLREGWEPDPGFLELLGIDSSWLERWPNELSGGELQRICIARALGPQTRYLIADEMTAMLDAITQAQLWHAVLSLVKERHLGLLAISHDRHLLQRICDRVITWEALTQRERVR